MTKQQTKMEKSKALFDQAAQKVIARTQNAQPQSKPVTTSLFGMPAKMVATSVTGELFPSLKSTSNHFEALNTAVKLAEKNRKLVINIDPELDILFDEEITVEALQKAVLG